MPTLSQTLLQHYFSLFRTFIESQDGRPLSSFSNGYLDEQEGYKRDIHREARLRMEYHSWKKGSIGSGSILNSVISAIEINTNELRNNLVPWQARHGEGTSGHRWLLEAKKQREQRMEWEKLLFDFYCGNDAASDQRLFEQMIALAGKQYPLIAYLFFLKNERKYLPISPRNFDEAFEVLGVPEFCTEKNCSWENYCSYLSLVSQTQMFLRQEMGEDINLLDAHSFLWIVARDLAKSATVPVIPILVPEELHLQPAPPVLTRTNTHNKPSHFDAKTAEEEQKENTRIGNKAEELVQEAEKEVLRKAGRKDLAAKVAIVSENASLGYDILSFSLDGQEKYIEVKGTTTKGGYFFLTANELHCSQHIPNYYLYIVTGIDSKDQSIHYLSGPKFESELFSLEPLKYRVRYLPRK